MKCCNYLILIKIFIFKQEEKDTPGGAHSLSRWEI